MIEEEEIVPFKEQMKKFAIKSLIGYQTILVFGIGRRLGIFDYLAAKARNERFKSNQKNIMDEEIEVVKFRPEKVTNALKLDKSFFDGWLHMGVAAGIFEIENSSEKIVKTAPHVYKLLMDRESGMYIGSNLGGFYILSLFQKELFDSFHSGNTMSLLALPEEFKRDGNYMSAFEGNKLEELFAKTFGHLRRILRKGGNFLDIGCGYGFNFKKWANKYRKTSFIGIDIDKEAIESAKTLINENNWGDRVKFYDLSLEDFIENNRNLNKNHDLLKFDVIMLNQVLHEMDDKNNYRKKVIDSLYDILSDDGIVLIGEHLVADMFDKVHGYQLFEVMHKWFEVLAGSKFYSEQTIKDLVAKTRFQKAYIIRDKNDYLIALKKKEMI